MKRTLYIDFDGVILDTISIIYKDADEKGINLNDVDICREFFINYDWYKLLKNAPVLADSINAIRRLEQSGMYTINILTHVYSIKETNIKLDFLEENIPNIKMIPVPKGIKKTDVVDNVKNTILVDDYKGNLRDWEKAGGIAYRFCTMESDDEFITINSLDDLLIDNRVLI